MPATDEITELVELDAEKVSGVGNPANGTPFLLLKAVGEEDAEKAAGSHAEDTESAEADEIEDTMTKEGADAEKAAGTHGEDTPSAEADEIERTLTKAIESFCGGEECEVCKDIFPRGLSADVIEKAKLKAKQRNAMPASDFAYTDSQGNRHLPINDAAHVRNALARFDQTEFDSAEAKTAAHAKVVARAKSLGVDVAKGYEDGGLTIDLAKAYIEAGVMTPEEARHLLGVAVKSPGVPAESVEMPTEAGHVARTGDSGLAGPETGGVVNSATSPSFAEGGKAAEEIPAEARQDQHTHQREQVRENRPDGAATKDTDDDLIEVIDVAEKADFLTLTNSMADGGDSSTDPGSPAWESYDSSTLDKVASGLASCAAAVAAIQQREYVEAVSGDPSDWFDACELGQASDAINYALGFVARLAYHEAAAAGGEATKAVSGAHARAALSHLTALLGDGANHNAGSTGTKSQEDIDMATVTKEELTQLVTDAAKAAAEGLVEEARQASKEAKKAADAAEGALAELRAVKESANNGGDVTAEQERAAVHGEHDADDVDCVGGSVDSKFVNKGAESVASGEGAAFEAISKELAATRELLEKMAARPRSGGPVLDGVARGGAFPATEQRLETAAKGAEDPEIERLAKSMEQATDNVRKAELSQELTFARLRKAHEDGLI